MLVTHGQQSVSLRSCPVTSWEHPGVETTDPPASPVRLGRPSQGLTEQPCPTHSVEMMPLLVLKVNNPNQFFTSDSAEREEGRVTPNAFSGSNIFTKVELKEAS